MAKLLRYLKPIWWEIVLDIIFLAAQAYSTLQITGFMSTITSIMEAPKTYATTMSGLVNLWNLSLFPPTGDHMTDTWIVGGAMLVMALAFLLFAFASSLMGSFIGAYYGAHVRHDVFQRVSTMPVESYYKFGTATLITRTTNDIEQTQNAIQMGLRIMIMSPVSLVVALVLIFSMDSTLALIVACSIPFIIIVVVLLLVFATPLFTKIQVGIDKLTGVLRESLKGVRVIRAFNQQEKEYSRFQEANKNLTDLSIKTGRLMSFGSPAIGIAFDVTYMIVFYYGFTKVDGLPASEAIDFSNIIVSAQYAMQLMNSFLMFMFLLILIPRAQASAKRINEILATPDLIKNPLQPKTSEHNSGLVEFKDVSFAFPGASVPTLSHISFAAKPGVTTAIIGSTGSGKSTIVSLIPRFYDTNEGSILVDGIDVRDYDKKDLRNKLGFVPQTAQLFKGTIRENIAFGKEGATDEEITRALEVAQAWDFISGMEKGLDSEVEQDGKNFSGGQKQRLAIARALVRKPEIYVFDDSFSALDFKTDIKLRKALRGYTGNASILIVAQRVSTIIDADNIVVLDNGRKVGEGTHKELLSSCQVYQEIVASQLDKDEIAKTLSLASSGGQR